MPNVHHVLKKADEIFYKPCGINLSYLFTHEEGKDYGACRIKLNDMVAEFRVGKTTPKKVGHFATLWQRSADGITIPYDHNDAIDLFIISTSTSQHCGQFMFTKNALVQQDYVSQHGVGGKRAMRVYPPWEVNLNDTARKTQIWQLAYFVKEPTARSTTSNYLQTLFRLSGKA